MKVLIAISNYAAKDWLSKKGKNEEDYLIITPLQDWETNLRGRVFNSDTRITVLGFPAPENPLMKVLTEVAKRQAVTSKTSKVKFVFTR